MIKQIGTLGFFIKFNESASSSFKFLEIFSSSANTTSLFSASTTASSTVSFPTSASMYVNGTISNSASSLDWVHMTFTFNPKLEIDADNDFTVRFGNASKGDFNIQNIYMVDRYLFEEDMLALHGEFSGQYVAVSASNSVPSTSLKLIDKDESRHSSSVTGNVYQPLPAQTRLAYDITAVSNFSLSAYTSTLPLVDGMLYHDGVRLQDGDYVLSLVDNALYIVNSNDDFLTVVPTSNGDYVNVLRGQEYRLKTLVKVSGVFIPTQFIEKIAYVSTER